MTAREFIQWFASLPWWSIMLIFTAPPLIALAAGFIHGKNKGYTSPWKYLYSVLIYWVYIPGVLAAMLTAYTLFFTGENLLDQNLVVYILPIISMVITLVCVKKNVLFDDIPGFERLSGLILVIAITFVFILAIQKTRLWLFFGASIFVLAAFVIFLVALLQWGMKMLFGKGD